MKKTSVEGYMTVYISLSLGIIISLITSMLYFIRIQTIRFECECVMDMGLDSIFAEYNREMLEQYDLLFIDSTYGGSVASTDYILAHLLHYMNLNFHDVGEGILTKDLTAINADNGIIAEISFPSDNRGEVLRYQISQLSVKGLLDSKEWKNDVNIASLLEEYDGRESEREASCELVESILDDINSQLEEDEEPYSVSNPADAVDKGIDSNILYYSFGEMSNLRLSNINLSDYFSHRSYKNGAGLREYQKADSVLDKYALLDYIFNHCGFYGNEKENSELSYEIEYLLAGNSSDIQNIEEIARDIFKTRYVINMAHIFSCSSKMAEAEELAALATSVILLPELTEAVKLTILFAWGYAESAKDMRILFDGHKLSLVKSEADWNTPLGQLVGFKTYLNNYKIPSGELDYKKYLMAMISTKDAEVLTMRLMDIMEMDLRRTPGNQFFMVDKLVYQLTANINVSSGYGYGCNIKRNYSYE